MVTKPIAPTPPARALRSNPDTFSANAEGTINYLWDTFPDYVDDALDYVEERSNALLLESLPDLTGQADKILTVNGTEDAVALLTAPAGDLVGTTASQTLTNKAMTAPVLNNPDLTGSIGGNARATQSLAEGGVSNVTMMTPLRTKEAINFISSMVPIGTYSTSTIYQKYDATVTYDTGDLIILADVVYESRVDSNTGNDPASSPTQWDALSSDWLVGTTYAAGDYVKSSTDKLYISLTSSNTGNDPDSDAVNWQEVFIGVAEIDIVFPREFAAVVLDCSNIIPTTDAQDMLLRVSPDSGSSFDSGASDYSSEIVTRSTPSIATDAIQIAHSVGAADGEPGWSGTITIHNPGAAGARTMVSTEGVVVFSDGGIYPTSGGGYRAAAQAVDAVRILFSSGNIASGEIHAYGLTVPE